MNDETNKKEDSDAKVSEESPKFSVKDRRHWMLEEEDKILEEETKDRLPTYVEKLKQEAEEKDRRLREYIAAYKDKNAENDEFRIRLQRENQTRVDQLKADFFKKLIPIQDNLKRAVDSAQSETDFTSLKEGVRLILAQFQKELLESGVEKIEAQGKTFDPKTGEVVLTVDTDDPQQDNVVVEDLETGYRYKDHLIRPARVKVAKLKPQ